MRWLSSAICTSGEPVSPSVVAYSAMIFFLVSASVPTDMRAPSVLSLRGAPGPVHPGTLDPRPFYGGFNVCVVALVGNRCNVPAGSGAAQTTEQGHREQQDHDLHRRQHGQRPERHHDLV